MEENIKRDVRSVIEEIDSAYNDFSDYHYMNADYADFASMALGQFRDAMRDPELTRENLERLLRKGLSKSRNLNPETNWKKYVASYMAKSANMNYMPRA